MVKNSMTQINIHVPTGLYKRFRVRCVRKMTTVREVLEGMMELYLSGEVIDEEAGEKTNKKEKE